MKYLMTVFFATTLSFGAFALGQTPGSATGSQDCCNSGKCGGGMPLCDGYGRIPNNQKVTPTQAKGAKGKTSKSRGRTE